MDNNSKQIACDGLPLRMSKTKSPKLHSCLKRPKRTPEPRHKTVWFSSYVEYIPRSPLPDTESRDNSSQTRTCTSRPIYPHSAGHSFCIPRKPVPANPNLFHPVPMCRRQSTPPMDLDSLTNSSSSGALPWLCTDISSTPLDLDFLIDSPSSDDIPWHCTDFYSNEFKQLPLPLPEIEDVQSRIEAFIDSEEYRQYLVNQSLIQSHLAPYFYSPIASPNSIMASEELSVVRPTYLPPPPSRMPRLRQVATLHTPQPDSRQRLSLRAEIRKVLSSCNSKSCSSGSSDHHRGRTYWRQSAPVTTKQPVTERNTSPEDWYPPRKFRHWQWRPADEVLNGERLERHHWVERFLRYTRSLLCGS